VQLAKKILLKLNFDKAVTSCQVTPLQHLNLFLLMQECLRDALLKTYTEYKQVRDRLSQVEKAAAEKEAAFKVEAAHAAREFKMQLEASVELCKRKQLKLNKLEVSVNVGIS
jgi:hypothetical protein